MTALQDLTALVTSLPSASLLTDTMKQDALAGALVPDSFGVWPGNEGYEPTYDIYYAAAQLIGFLQAQPVVRQTSSEGTSIAVDAPNWGGLLAYYRSMSPIAQASRFDILRPIPIPGGPHVDRIDMSGNDAFGGRTADGDIDTDLG